MTNERNYSVVEIARDGSIYDVKNGENLTKEEATKLCEEMNKSHNRGGSFYEVWKN